MQDFFAHYSFFIVFLHVLSAVIWIGGMITIKIAVHPVLHTIKNEQERVQKSIMIVGRLFTLVIPSIILLVATGVIFELALGLSKGSNAIYIHIKEAIWTLMSINFVYMFIRRVKAKKLFEQGKSKEAAALMKNIPHLLLPINIFLGLFAIALGVILRGL